MSTMAPLARSQRGGRFNLLVSGATAVLASATHFGDHVGGDADTAQPKNNGGSIEIHRTLQVQPPCANPEANCGLHGIWNPFSCDCICVAGFGFAGDLDCQTLGAAGTSAPNPWEDCNDEDAELVNNCPYFPIVHGRGNFDCERRKEPGPGVFVVGVSREDCMCKAYDPRLDCNEFTLINTVFTPTTSAGPTLSAAPSTTTSKPTDSPSLTPTSLPANPSLTPTLDCSIPPAEGCGYGIYMEEACECVCAKGACLSLNGQCYTGCDTNPDPFVGCTPGVTCPWWPSVTSLECESFESVPDGVFTIYPTAEECCSKHYGATNSCEAASIASVGATLFSNTTEKEPFYYPDLNGVENCVFDSAWDDWMNMPGYSESYLFTFEDAAKCCDMWYPDAAYCPLEFPSNQPSASPSITNSPVQSPSDHPSPPPSTMPSSTPSESPSNSPSQTPSLSINPSFNPTGTPTKSLITAAVLTQNAPLPTPQLINAVPSLAPGPWHMTLDGTARCINDDDYPDIWNNPAYTSFYLFADPAECCETNFRKDVTCALAIAQLTAEASPPGNQAVDGDTATKTSQALWHIVTDPRGMANCTNDQNYPQAWNDEEIRHHYLFSTADLCCDVSFDTTGCGIKVVPSGRQLKDTSSSQQNALLAGNVPNDAGDVRRMTKEEDKKEPVLSQAGNHARHHSLAEARHNAEAYTHHVMNKWYPKKSQRTCINDGRAPDYMLLPGYPEKFLFETKADCCAQYDCSGSKLRTGRRR